MGSSRWGGRQAQRLVALTLAVHGTTCHLCLGPGATTADHLIPRAHGGANVISNLRPAHHGCNSSRGAMTMAQWWERHPIADPAESSREW